MTIRSSETRLERSMVIKADGFVPEKVERREFIDVDGKGFYLGKSVSAIDYDTLLVLYRDLLSRSRFHGF